MVLMMGAVRRHRVGSRVEPVPDAGQGQTGGERRACVEDGSPSCPARAHVAAPPWTPSSVALKQPGTARPRPEVAEKSQRRRRTPSRPAFVQIALGAAAAVGPMSRERPGGPVTCGDGWLWAADLHLWYFGRLTFVLAYAPGSPREVPGDAYGPRPARSSPSQNQVAVSRRPARRGR